MKEKAFWANYKYIAEAIAKLFAPWAEVVIHDLQKNQIVHIAGNFSQRRAGDSSLFTEEEKSWREPVIGPYKKVNADGRELKSISVPLFELGNNEAKGMLCINADVSDLVAIRNALGLFCQTEEMPSLNNFFEKNWQDRINEFVGAFLKKREKKLSGLSREDKKDLIGELYESGAFNEKNAATYISRAIGISRASVYTYLKQKGHLS